MADPVKTNENRRSGIFVVALLVLLSLLLFGWAQWQTPDASEVAKDQWEKIKAGKLTEAYYAYTSKDFQASTNLDAFKAFLKALPFEQAKYLEFEGSEGDENLQTVKGLLKDDNGNALALQYQLVPEDGDWKILSIRTLASEANKGEQKTFNEEIVHALKNFLNTIKEHRGEEAYNTLTTEEFRKITSLKTFNEFIAHFPIFSSFEEVKTISADYEGEMAVVKAELIKKGAHVTATFTLFNQNQWLIQGVHVDAQKQEESTKSDFETDQLKTPIQEQLKALQEGNLQEAYDKFTAYAFREATSFERFKEFVEGNTLLTTHTSLEFLTLSFSNNVAEYKTLLQGEGQKQKVEFSLIQEGTEWKILQIQIF